MTSWAVRNSSYYCDATPSNRNYWFLFPYPDMVATTFILTRAFVLSAFLVAIG